MAGSSLLALIDDITTVLDDVAAMTKVAAKKTAGVLGDDLALNAQQVTGLGAERELPVVWSVTKGSFVNKLILVPAALAISAIIPWAVTPLLMIGGAFLCYEGFEKLSHSLTHRKAEDEAHRAELIHAVNDPAVDLVAFEKGKIKGAIRTDFILSAEIIAITLATVAGAPLGTQLAVLSSISLVMTVGVYGLVAGIVKLDDGGLRLSRAGGEHALAAIQRSLGRGILRTAPYMMKSLSFIGTAAMFMVGGGIIAHGIAPLEMVIERLAHAAATVAVAGKVLQALLPTLLYAVAGVITGAVVLGVVSGARRAFESLRKQPSWGPAE